MRIKLNVTINGDENVYNFFGLNFQSYHTLSASYEKVLVVTPGFQRSPSHEPMVAGNLCKSTLLSAFNIKMK